MSEILLLMDSRGLEFENIVKEVLDINPQSPTVKILAVRGANLQSIEHQAIAELKRHRYDQTYIMLGVNNMTKLFFRKQIILAFDNIPELVDTIDDMFSSLKVKLQPYTPKVIVCHLIGLDILTYNLARMGHDELLVADYPDMQRIVNASIPLINRAIDSMNISSSLIGPWIEDTVHCNINGKITHKYLRLADGLHPTSSTKRIWAKKLTKAFRDNQ